MKSSRIDRVLDVFAGVSLFVCGSLILWLTLFFWLSPLGLLAASWRIAVFLAAGGTSAVAAIALFFTPRVAGVIGAYALFSFACFFAALGPLTLKDLWGPALLTAVAIAVYWRFVRRRRGTPFI